MVGSASGLGPVATYLNWSHVRLQVTSQLCPRKRISQIWMGLWGFFWGKAEGTGRHKCTGLGWLVVRFILHCLHDTYSPVWIHGLFFNPFQIAPNSPKGAKQEGYFWATPSILEKNVILDKFWVKHWEHKSWITFKLLSFKIRKSYE